MNRKSLLIIISLTSVLMLAHLAIRTKAALPSDYNLKEGDLVRAVSVNDPDIFIINDLGYKRLFLNPVIFSFYGHLGGFSAVKSIASSTRDAFITSPVVRNCESNDAKVYSIETTGADTAIIHWLNVAGDSAVKSDPNFFKKVFCINNSEFNWYQRGADYTSLDQAPQPTLIVPTPAPGLKVDLKINGSDTPSAVAWNSEITATWTSENVSKCSGFEYMHSVDPTFNTTNLLTSGTVKLYARNTFPINDSKVMIHIICYKTETEYADDYILLNVTNSSLPSITVVSPTNTAIGIIGQDLAINWTSTNLPGFKINVLVMQSNNNSVYKGIYGYITRGTDNDGSYTWKIGDPTPDTARGTTNFKLTPGKYRLIITDGEESVLNISEEFTIN